MSTQRVANNIFQGRSYGEDDRDFHVITTDHEYMVDIGLGVFTTGILSSWWNKQYGDSYPNRNLLDIGELSDIGKKIYSASESPDYAYFTSWRQESKDYKKYIKVTSESGSTWRFSGTASETSLNYDQSDLGLDEYYKYETVNDLTTKPKHEQDSMSAFNDEFSILRIIELNNFVRLKKIKEPDESKWLSQERARAEFIRDIKSSKEGCLTWSVKMQFVFNFGSSQVVTTDPETVTFKLYLFDDNVPHNNERGAAMSDFTIVGTPLNALGIEYRNGSLVDGEWEAASVSPDTKNKTSGKIKLTYNELTGEWESGTTQIVARLLTNIPASTIGDVDEVYEAGIADLLDSNNTSATVVATGKAMPLSVHNGNPLQWGPVYKEPKGCRTDNKKRIVPVVNLVDRAWKQGETVILNQINGVWIPSPLSDQKEVEEVATAAVDGKWDFTYLMTNAEYFFRSVDSDSLPIDYITYELEFYNKYYDNTNLIKNLNPVSSGKKVGYYQLTSWDFMGPSIGGNRLNGHAIAQTQFGIDTQGNGTGDNQDGKNRPGTDSAPFFGCVFPDGYNSTEIYTTYQDLASNNLELKTINNNRFEYGNFFKDITSGSVFEDNNANVEGNSVEGGMFALNDSLLKHLPADIALNASPSGNNGRPISDINKIALYFDLSNTSNTSLINKCDTYFQNYNRYSWMYQQDTSSQTPSFLTSAFDLAPLDNSNIEFRPLKAEVYAIFEHLNSDTVDSQEAGKRGEFGARGWDMINDGKNPISTNFLNRNIGLRGQVGTANEYDSPSKNSLRYGYYDYQHKNDNFKNLVIPQSAKFPQFYWDSEWTFDRPAGAVGIIGAVCTVTANTAINFTTDNYLGMGTTFINGDWYASWGGLGGNNYNNLNTTQLYARIFTQWPRELTVYDHRFFAVHHFNYGVGQLTEEIKRIDGVDVAATEVDIRVPTGSDGKTLDIGVDIYSNSELRPQSEWNIPEDEGRQRRGKLLPYRYTRKTIGISSEPKTYIIHTDDPPPNTKNADIMIIKKGRYYDNGDKFITSGGSGDDILLECDTDEDGGITRFTVIRGGKDYLPEDFLTSSDLLNGLVTSSVKIIPSGTDSIGEEFEGYIIRGNIRQSPQLVDEAPKELTSSALQLTPLPPNVDAGGQSSAVQILDENKEQSLNITTKISNNKKYDIYLHFHNDISHTFAKQWGTTPKALEQMCRLKITPT